MKTEVKEHLITGLIQYLGAHQRAQANLLWLMLILQLITTSPLSYSMEGIKPTRNHKQKLKLMLSHFESLIRKAETTQDALEKFYDCWQKVRYSSFVPTPNETPDFIHLSYRVTSVIMKELADRNSKSYNELEKELYTEVLGNRWSSFDEEIGYIHERWQQEAEIQGEMGIGSKLGNKMLNPSNFCEVCVLANDLITREIIVKDPKFGSAVAKFYKSFLELVVYIQNARFKRGVSPDEITNFMLSLRLRYHGQTMKEIAEDWGAMIVKALKNS